ncbi:beta-Ala-His dipeptidase-like isoform X2 [Rhinatrema bivittatum]|nr:beta-Ala-His dipeptidase-like isoform X2 [Rhinatrema bivittatum]XP_029446728.1 beta-Ala-His dipeptidase-like isoform X2 [Rhinatrema bivittatum]XP_029446729.1 beta-Ala-His dipeptidase-like isoform X2 [Rhinatrema bivittatum]XP_029446731.1 beta-Ala-His dipeptidase-like isoform X2 [Rhinatrema bivittatum]XP_029446732.1 beta-Ala-His dipeptidase-like isoform X2 [Rhinatrema bivittatum]XP_029446733.1 beta-Ala-His dipeptidase-like isoform X2 [Rhinatrema bivittatum]
MLPLGAEASAPASSSVLLDQIFHHIDLQQDDFVQALKEWLTVESESSDPKLRGELTRMMDIAAKRIQALGATVELISPNVKQLIDEQEVPLPPVLLANLGNDTHKPTVCFYGHVDVQPAKMDDGWITKPYTMTEINGNLYARGASDDKGPVLAWIHAVETFIALKQDIPVNMKFIIEAMEEVGSLGLEETIKEHGHFFSDVDYIVISDNSWISRKPALTYGTRGDAYFFVEVKGGERDLHSGSFGGIIHEPMNDLIALLASLVDSSGHILIPGIYDDVAPITEEEKKLYDNIEFDLEEHKKNNGLKKFIQNSKRNLLMQLWRHPSLSIHGIEGAFYGIGSKTVIPAKVIGKFSIRQVPNMNLSVAEEQVLKHLENVFAKRNSPNKLTVTMPIAALPWVTDVKELQYEAARKAIVKVFGVDPDMIRDGATIPIAKTFQTLTQKRVMMIPIGGADDGEHSQNEKISRNNYIQGTKLFATFFLELAELHQKTQKD